MEAMLSSIYLEEIEDRVARAALGPWRSYVEGRDHTSGSSFIMTGSQGARGTDIELIGASADDQDFIAAARQDVPALVNEVRRLHALLGIV
jgi:hypothetical protein